MAEEKLTEQIKKINEAAHLSESEKDRLISELLKYAVPQSGNPKFSPAAGYVFSLLFSPVGLFIGGHYLLRYGEEGIKPGIICIVLTCFSLVIQFLFFRNLLRAFLSGLASFTTIPGM